MVTVNVNSYIPYGRIRAGIYNSLNVVGMVESNWIWYEQMEVQFFIVHWVIVDKESLQSNWIIETKSKSWLRRNWIGDVNVDLPGTSVTVGAKHAKITNISGVGVWAWVWKCIWVWVFFWP